MPLTGPQIYYIANVYPETVTAEEAETCPQWRQLSEDDQDYWRVAAIAVERSRATLTKE